MDMFLNILLYVSRYDQPLLDRVFCCVMSGLFLTLIVYLCGRYNRKREVKKQEAESISQKDANDKLMAKELFNANPFDGDDAGLYSQLKEKCNPQNFLEPYDARKVEISNDIYSKLDDAKDNSLVLKN